MLRGATTYKQRATQGRDFTGLLYGKITPTDIDALIEYQNKAYVFIEAKVEGAEMPFGQKLALERLCDDLQKVKPTLLILMKHNTSVEKEVDYAKGIVEKYRYKGFWKIPSKNPTVKQFVDTFLESLNR